MAALRGAAAVSAFQRPLCLCSAAERVCSAERECGRAWCEYELHAGGEARVQQTQAVFRKGKALILKTNQNMGRGLVRV